MRAALLFLLPFLGSCRHLAPRGEVPDLKRDISFDAASVCYTYTTTYLTTVGGPSASGPVPGTATQTGPASLSGQPGTTNTGGLVPTSQPGQTTATPSPATTAPSQLMVVFSLAAPAGGAAPTTAAGLQPNAATGNNTLQRKRQSSLSPVGVDLGYVSSGGVTDLCAAAKMYALGNGQLVAADTDVLVSADANLLPINLNDPTSEPITTDFEVVNGILVWDNALFYDGAAVFCLLNDVLYATFNSAGPPSGCVVVDLVVIAASACRDISSSASSGSSLTATAPQVSSVPTTGSVPSAQIPPTGSPTVVPSVSPSATNAVPSGSSGSPGPSGSVSIPSTPTIPGISSTSGGLIPTATLTVAVGQSINVDLALYFNLLGSVASFTTTPTVSWVTFAGQNRDTLSINVPTNWIPGDNVRVELSVNLAGQITLFDLLLVIVGPLPSSTGLPVSPSSGLSVVTPSISGSATSALPSQSALPTVFVVPQGSPYQIDLTSYLKNIGDIPQPPQTVPTNLIWIRLYNVLDTITNLLLYNIHGVVPADFPLGPVSVTIPVNAGTGITYTLQFSLVVVQSQGSSSGVLPGPSSTQPAPVTTVPPRGSSTSGISPSPTPLSNIFTLVQGQTFDVVLLPFLQLLGDSVQSFTTNPAGLTWIGFGNGGSNHSDLVGTVPLDYPPGNVGIQVTVLGTVQYQFSLIFVIIPSPFSGSSSISSPLPTNPSASPPILGSSTLSAAPSSTSASAPHTTSVTVYLGQSFTIDLTLLFTNPSNPGDIPFELTTSPPVNWVGLGPILFTLQGTVPINYGGTQVTVFETVQTLSGQLYSIVVVLNIVPPPGSSSVTQPSALPTSSPNPSGPTTSPASLASATRTSVSPFSSTSANSFTTYINLVPGQVFDEDLTVIARVFGALDIVLGSFTVTPAVSWILPPILEGDNDYHLSGTVPPLALPGINVVSFQGQDQFGALLNIYVNLVVSQPSPSSSTPGLPTTSPGNLGSVTRTSTSLSSSTASSVPIVINVPVIAGQPFTINATQVILSATGYVSISFPVILELPGFVISTNVDGNLVFTGTVPLQQPPGIALISLDIRDINGNLVPVYIELNISPGGGPSITSSGSLIASTTPQVLPPSGSQTGSAIASSTSPASTPVFTLGVLTPGETFAFIATDFVLAATGEVVVSLTPPTGQNFININALPGSSLQNQTISGTVPPNQPLGPLLISVTATTPNGRTVYFSLAILIIAPPSSSAVPSSTSHSLTGPGLPLSSATRTQSSTASSTSATPFATILYLSPGEFFSFNADLLVVANGYAGVESFTVTPVTAAVWISLTGNIGAHVLSGTVPLDYLPGNTVIVDLLTIPVGSTTATVNIFAQLVIVGATPGGSSTRSPSAVSPTLPAGPSSSVNLPSSSLSPGSTGSSARLGTSSSFGPGSTSSRGLGTSTPFASGGPSSSIIPVASSSGTSGVHSSASLQSNSQPAQSTSSLSAPAGGSSTNLGSSILSRPTSSVSITAGTSSSLGSNTLSLPTSSFSAPGQGSSSLPTSSVSAPGQGSSSLQTSSLSAPSGSTSPRASSSQALLSSSSIQSSAPSSAQGSSSGSILGSITSTQAHLSSSSFAQGGSSSIGPQSNSASTPSASSFSAPGGTSSTSSGARSSQALSSSVQSLAPSSAQGSSGSNLASSTSTQVNLPTSSSFTQGGTSSVGPQSNNPSASSSSIPSTLRPAPSSALSSGTSSSVGPQSNNPSASSSSIPSTLGPAPSSALSSGTSSVGPQSNSALTSSTSIPSALRPTSSSIISSGISSIGTQSNSASSLSTPIPSSLRPASTSTLSSRTTSASRSPQPTAFVISPFQDFILPLALYLQSPGDVVVLASATAGFSISGQTLIVNPAAGLLAGTTVTVVLNVGGSLGPYTLPFTFTVLPSSFTISAVQNFVLQFGLYLQSPGDIATLASPLLGLAVDGSTLIVNPVVGLLAGTTIAPTIDVIGSGGPYTLPFTITVLPLSSSSLSTNFASQTRSSGSASVTPSGSRALTSAASSSAGRVTTSSASRSLAQTTTSSFTAQPTPLNCRPTTDLLAVAICDVLQLQYFSLPLQAYLPPGAALLSVSAVLDVSLNVDVGVNFGISNNLLFGTAPGPALGEYLVTLLYLTQTGVTNSLNIELNVIGFQSSSSRAPTSTVPRSTASLSTTSSAYPSATIVTFFEQQGSAVDISFSTLLPAGDRVASVTVVDSFGRLVDSLAYDPNTNSLVGTIPRTLFGTLRVTIQATTPTGQTVAIAAQIIIVPSTSSSALASSTSGSMLSTSSRPLSTSSQAAPPISQSSSTASQVSSATFTRGSTLPSTVHVIPVTQGQQLVIDLTQYLQGSAIDTILGLVSIIPQANWVSLNGLALLVNVPVDATGLVSVTIGARYGVVITYNIVLELVITPSSTTSSVGAQSTSSNLATRSGSSSVIRTSSLPASSSSQGQSSAARATSSSSSGGLTVITSSSTVYTTVTLGSSSGLASSSRSSSSSLNRFAGLLTADVVATPPIITPTGLRPSTASPVPPSNKASSSSSYYVTFTVTYTTGSIFVTRTAAQPSGTAPGTVTISSPFPTFTCDSSAYLVTQATLHKVDLTSGSDNILNSDNLSNGNGNVNALAYNPTDNFIYGVTQTGASSTFVKISALGTSILGNSLNFTNGLSLTGAEIDQSGYYWAFELVPATNNVIVLQYDLRNNSASYGSLVSNHTTDIGNYNVYDWALIPTATGAYQNSLYAIGSSSVDNTEGTTLLQFNMGSFSWTPSTYFGHLSHNTSDDVFGALYATPNGYIYGSENNSGDIWKFPIPGTGAPDTNRTGYAPGPWSGRGNDGARCYYASLDGTIDYAVAGSYPAWQ